MSAPLLFLAFGAGMLRLPLALRPPARADISRLLERRRGHARRRHRFTRAGHDPRPHLCARLYHHLCRHLVGALCAHASS